MSEIALKYILSFTAVVLLIVVGALIQNWWDQR